MTDEEIIAKAKELPVVSETARKLTIQLNQPDLHRDELVKTIRCDNVLTAKVLRACNCADAGLRQPVESLNQALLLLGDESIFRMVCAIGYGSSLNMSGAGYETEANGLWTHSLFTGLGAEYLAEVASYGAGAASAAFTAGLLHDIGKTVINNILTPKERADIRNIIAAKAINRVKAEKAVLGADHAEVGACLLRRWSLPQVIIEAVANHHAPKAKPSVRMSAVVYLANNAAHLTGSSAGWENYATQVKASMRETLGLDLAEIDRLIDGAQSAMNALPQLAAAA